MQLSSYYQLRRYKEYMKEEQAIKYLKELRSWVSFSSGANFGISTNAIYITPAQQLRNSADEMERKDKILKEIDEFLTTYVVR